MIGAPAMIGRLHHTIVEAADPQAEGRFWAAVLGRSITYDDGDFVVVSATDRTSGLAFQRCAGHRAPAWPDEHGALQMHLDVMVDDLDEAATAVTALGATALPGGEHVYADPAGHPFCLINRPGWASPVNP